jgi:hypothetical protein
VLADHHLEDRVVEDLQELVELIPLEVGEEEFIPDLVDKVVLVLQLFAIKLEYWHQQKQLVVRFLIPQPQLFILSYHQELLQLLTPH